MVAMVHIIQDGAVWLQLEFQFMVSPYDGLYKTWLRENLVQWGQKVRVDAEWWLGGDGWKGTVVCATIFVQQVSLWGVGKDNHVFVVEVEKFVSYKISHKWSHVEAMVICLMHRGRYISLTQNQNLISWMMDL